jgi:hypothetical protein
MVYRCFRKIDTGQWLNVLFTVDEDQFSLPEASHRGNIATALGLRSEDLESVDGVADPRIGALMELSATAPSPQSISRARIAEINAIPRSTWTTAQLCELLQVTDQEVLD